MVLRERLLKFISALSLLIVAVAVSSVVIFELQLDKVNGRLQKSFTSAFSTEAHTRSSLYTLKLSQEIRGRDEQESLQRIAYILSSQQLNSPSEMVNCVFSPQDGKILYAADYKNQARKTALIGAMMKLPSSRKEDLSLILDRTRWFILADRIPETPYWYGTAINVSSVTRTLDSVLSPIAAFHRYTAVGMFAVAVLLLCLVQFAGYSLVKKAVRMEEERNRKDEELSQMNLLLTAEVNIRKKIEDELKDANKELHQLSMTDNLTEIANRRKFDQTMEKEWLRHMREKREISLILCDVDFFKKYNDRNGHQKGDECLTAVAAILQKACRRPADLAARYGGEEFCLILPETDRNGALLVAHNIQRMTAEAALPHGASTVSDSVTISIGIATAIPEETESILLFQAADRALYRAKEHGRNRIEV